MMIKQTVNNPVTLTTERISILLDGEMDRAEAEAVITALCQDAELRRQWHQLHLAGDALRSHEVAIFDAESFCARVAAVIAGEPTVLAPRAERSSTSGSAALRRYWIPGVAVAASAAVVSLIAVPLLRTPQTTTIAKSAAPMTIEAAPDPAAGRELPTIANARQAFSPYLAAHRELTGNTVVPRAAVYLRSDEGR